MGKTLSKLTLWDGVRLVERRTRPNARCDAGNYAALDAAGIEAWLIETLADFALIGRVEAIVPVAHGAAAAVLREGRLAAPPVDYEHDIARDWRTVYDAQRDSFAFTGSPGLPGGLNLGAQFDLLDRVRPDLLTPGATIVTWPQYWGWVLSGVAAVELTSLGCHSDLYRPVERGVSALAQRRGWADLLAPLRGAGDVLGPIRPDLATRTGLPADVRVHVGLHDSNAALLAARGFPEIAGHESTVLSTGTWFVAMRSPPHGAVPDIAALDPARDCLVNIDVAGTPVPSARLMGGREIELLGGLDPRRVDIRSDQPRLVAAVPDLVATGVMALPTLTPGVGPFPAGEHRWVAAPDDPYARRAAACLYAALVTEVALEQIGTRERLLIEGRFAEAEVFVRALATLRPDLRVYVSNAHNDVSLGALRLLDPGIRPDGELRLVAPLDVSLDAYRAVWRELADTGRVAA
jgi:sugar (pentulose or hexulose) kinase